MFVAGRSRRYQHYAAIQTALVQRASTGQGQRVDVALMDCMLNLLVYELQEAQFPVATPRLPSYGPVSATDGDLLIAPITPKISRPCARRPDRRTCWKDPRFAAVAARAANWGAMMLEIERWTSQRSVDNYLAVLDAAGVPARANDTGAALASPRGFPRSPMAQTFLGVNAPWKNVRCRHVDRPPCAEGQ